jgi:hypothetical protein
MGVLCTLDASCGPDKRQQPVGSVRAWRQPNEPENDSLLSDK